MEAGHNSKDDLKSIVERIEKLNETIKDFRSDVTDLYAEAKGSGYNPKALRVVIRQRSADAKKAAELQADVDDYMVALGMVAD